MSHGRVVEQGTHDELYARDGMYRGLVDAQRISAEGTGDGGDETPEEIVEVEEALRRSRSYSVHRAESPSLVRRTTTGLSTSIEIKETKFGIVERQKYSLYTLLKKVKYSAAYSDLGPCIQQRRI